MYVKNAIQYKKVTMLVYLQINNTSNMAIVPFLY